jgi:PleD family two-component response regulator
MRHRNELNETNLMKPKQNLEQVQLKQHDEFANVDLLLGIKNERKLNQKIEKLVDVKS